MLNVSADRSLRYISFMNCVFSSQKLGVRMDSCNLSPSDATFLQQAASITAGVYVRVSADSQCGLLQYLLSVFLLDRPSSRVLRTPAAVAVDFRPSCFCHRLKVEQGRVCSVCLSVFCEESSHQMKQCGTCGVTFTAS